MKNTNHRPGAPRYAGSRASWHPVQREDALHRGAYSINDSEESILELLQRTRESLFRLWVAARYQFHRRTFGIFRPVSASWLKSGLVIAGVYFVFFAGQGDALTLDAPFSLVAEEGAGSSETFNWAAAVSMQEPSGNPFAPASPADLRRKEVDKYIGRFTNVAVAEMDKFGVPASILMAQGIIESRCGQSTLATRVNNHFGIKCFSKKCQKGHCTNFEDDHHKDFFRMYASAWESWRDHTRLLSEGRYKKLHKLGKDYAAWARGLKEAGYATDSDYDDKLIGIIQRYELHKLDDL